MKKIESRNLKTVLETPTHLDRIRFDYDLKHQQAVDRLNTFNNHYYFPYMKGISINPFGDAMYRQWLLTFQMMGLCGNDNSIENQSKLITSPSGWEISRGCILNIQGTPTACEWYVASVEVPETPYLLATARAMLLGVRQVVIIKLMECGSDPELLPVDHQLITKVRGKLAYFNEPSI